jgi:hypothetical protein
MSPKNKYTLVRLVLISVLIGGLQFLCTAVLPKQLGYEAPKALNSFFPLLNIIVIVYVGNKLRNKYDAMHRSASDDRPSDKAEAEASDQRK